jgi:uncharacterized protein with HEPN domain
MDAQCPRGDATVCNLELIGEAATQIPDLFAKPIHKFRGGSLSTPATG